MTRRELIDQQHRQHLEQSQLVGYWAKTQGITQRDLDQHPCIDDVVLLKKFRKEFWDLPKFFIKPYNKIYKSVYQGKIPLKAKQLSTLTRIAEAMIKWRKRRQQQQNQIKALRQNPTNKKSQFITEG